MLKKMLFGIEWEVDRYEDKRGGDFYFCKRSDFGEFHITVDATRGRLQEEDHDYKILSVLYEYMLMKRKIIVCEKEDSKEALARDGFNVCTLINLIEMFPKTHLEKQGRILLNLYRLNKRLGAAIEDVFESYKYYSYDKTELGYLLELMNNKGLIKVGVQWSGGQHRQPRILVPLIIEEKGWLYIEDITRAERLNNAFVAMWFDSKMDAAYKGIEGILRNHGFNPVRIDQKEHNNEISGEILYEIKRSRFVIADVTGQRQGVYFEAGYAMGIGIPVIWSCQEDNKNNVHFDTRQYNHIFWKDESDLASQLEDRIKGTILLDEA